MPRPMPAPVDTQVDHDCLTILPSRQYLSVKIKLAEHTGPSSSDNDASGRLATVPERGRADHEGQMSDDLAVGCSDVPFLTTVLTSRQQRYPAE